MSYGYSSDPEVERSTDRVLLWAVILTLALAAAFPLYLLIEPSSRESARAAQLESLAEEGESIWGFSCAACHGESGQGGSAPALNAKQFLQSANDDQIQQLIAVGIPGSAMSAYSQDFAGPLTSSQIRALSTYIRSWEEIAPDNPNWRLGAQEPAGFAPDMTGQEIYAAACASCHGTELEGGIGPELDRGSEAADESDSRLTTRIVDGKDNMPSFSDKLSDDQVAVVLSYIRSAQTS